MSVRGLAHNNLFIFDGTNYDLWKIYVLKILRGMSPDMERFLGMGFSSPKDPQNLSLEEEKNSCLDALASHVFSIVVSNVVTSSIMPFGSAHELWTKLQDKYDVSNIIEDDCIASTSGHDELSSSSTSPKCVKTQGNDMVSGDENCNVDIELTIDDSSSLSHCNASSLDLNTSSTRNDLHACVDSPCISCVSCLNKSNDDMLALSCGHDKNASISSSCCVTNIVEETKDSIGQDKILKGASSNSSSLSHGPHICLMAKGSTVPPTMEPNMSRGDKDEDEYEEEDWVVSLRDKGKSVFKVLYKDKIASSHFFEILTTAIESQKLIWMHENTIDKKGALEREYADDVASLKNDLEEEQETVASLEEQLQTLEVSQNEIFAKLTKERDHAKAKLKLLKNEKSKVGVGHDKLVKDLDDLDKAHKALESEHSILTKSYEQLQASYLKEHAMLPSLLDMSCDDACATNSTSCEASILKENVELRAQLDLLTSNYGKLEENHGKLSSSHEDLLASHDRLKLAHEAIISKATPCEPHVDTSTTTQNAILPCASPSNSSTHSIAKSCDELSSLPCCSNNEGSTSSSTCVVTNHVEEIKELKAQVTSLKNDLVKSHEGKCKLDTMLSMQQSPNDKSGLGFKSNNKNKSNNNNKGQVQVKDPAKIVCFKCKIEGHHVRSCPLKKKQKGKRPQAQTHIQPQVEEMPLPKKNQANAPIVEKSSEKKEKKRTCYICREKGHISSFCTIGTSSNSITIDDVYSLRKDEGGNVFAKYVGAQSGVKKRTIWVAKPIVTNLLGPNLVGDQQSKT